MVSQNTLISVTRTRTKRLATLVLLQNRPEGMCHLPNTGLMLAHRLQCWPNIKLALGRRLVFALVWSGVVGHCAAYLLTENTLGLHVLLVLASHYRITWRGDWQTLYHRR